MLTVYLHDLDEQLLSETLLPELLPDVEILQMDVLKRLMFALSLQVQVPAYLSLPRRIGVVAEGHSSDFLSLTSNVTKDGVPFDVRSDGFGVNLWTMRHLLKVGEFLEDNSTFSKER